MLDGPVPDTSGPDPRAIPLLVAARAQVDAWAAHERLTLLGHGVERVEVQPRLTPQGRDTGEVDVLYVAGTDVLRLPYDPALGTGNVWRFLREPSITWTAITMAVEQLNIAAADLHADWRGDGSPAMDAVIARAVQGYFRRHPVPACIYLEAEVEREVADWIAHRRAALRAVARCTITHGQEGAIRHPVDASGRRTAEFVHWIIAEDDEGMPVGGGRITYRSAASSLRGTAPSASGRVEVSLSLVAPWPVARWLAWRASVVHYRAAAAGTSLSLEAMLDLWLAHLTRWGQVRRALRATVAPMRRAALRCAAWGSARLRSRPAPWMDADVTVRPAASALAPALSPTASPPPAIRRSDVAPVG